MRTDIARPHIADVRRARAGAGGLLATATEHANAAVLLEDADGDSFTAYEAPFSIRVAATQDAVSTSDVQAFKKDHSKYAGLQLAQKKTLHVRPWPVHTGFAMLHTQACQC